MLGGGYNGFYSYPIPGTGTVGVDCDLLDPVLETDSVLTSIDKCKNSDIFNMTSWEKFQCGILQKIKKSKDPKDVVSSEDTEGADKNSGLDDYLPAIMGPNGEYSNAADLPCNWNKIKFGDTVNIPLYGLSEEGEQVPLKLNDFILRVRTPCVAECDEFMGGSCKEPPEFCDERYELDTLFTAPSDTSTWSKQVLGDTVISWSIENGKCGDDYCYLDNMLVILESGVAFTKALEQDSSLITAHRITDKLDGNFEILVQNSMNDVYGLVNSDEKKKKVLKKFLGMVNEEESEDEEEIKLTADSYLKLSFIKGVTDDNYEKTPLPYLEYQFLYTSDTSAGGSAASLMPEDLMVVSEGSSGGFKKILKARYSPKTGIINYVIQQ